MNEEIHETPSTTPNFQTELAAQLADLIPEAIADGKVDIVKLQELLGADTADASERFGLFWPGKKRALRAAQEPTTATLRPDFENSKDWDTAQNVFIEGDNLEVLKILQKHYHAKIKLIYIDPPYNTGNDFVYPDNFKEGLDTYLDWTKQVNEEGKRVSTNSETEGRYHSNWLNMMYSRLKLARNLLTDDGAIFISIDDHESANLRRLCDEVYGEQNFRADISWQKRYTRSNNTRDFTTVVEHIFVYARSATFAVNLLPRTDEADNRYTNPDKDPRGPWKGASFLNPATPQQRPNLCYAITNPSTGQIATPTSNAWRRSRAEFERLKAEGLLYWGADGKSAVPSIKMFLSEARGLTPINLWDHSYAGNTDDGTKDLTALFDRKVFENPKPVLLLKRVLEHATDKDSVVLDFFSGSGTLAEATLSLNAEDGGKRIFLLVQLPEPTPMDSGARAAGYETISSITRKRIALAGDALLAEEARRVGDGSPPLDIGFRSYKLADTNFSKWRLGSDVDAGQLEQHLLGLRDSSADDASADDLFAEILLKQGYSLTEKIVSAKVAGLDVRIVGDNLVLAYLNEHTKPTLDQLRVLVDQDPARIIVLEDSFQGDDELKTNLAQLCRSKGIELWTA